MKIADNKIITGMFVYDSSSNYTVDDFVIKSGVIYICCKDVIGEDPETSECFKVYLGDRATTIPEYLTFLENPQQGKNKYISVDMLQGVLSYYMLGPTGKGIIGDYVYFDPKTSELSYRISTTSNYISDPESIISQIFFHEDINNAILRVSRTLPELYPYIGNPGISDISTLDEKSAILRQYTYLQEGTDTKVRVQELIDPIDGVIWYRSSVLTTNVSGSAVTGNWVCSIINGQNLKEKAENTINLYASRLKILKSLESQLTSNFRFRDLALSEGRHTAINITGLHEITVLVSESLKNGLTKNYSVSIDLMDKFNGFFPEYAVGDSLKLHIEDKGNDVYLVQLLDISGGELSENTAWFTRVYYKEYYGAS